MITNIRWNVRQYSDVILTACMQTIYQYWSQKSKFCMQACQNGLVFTNHLTFLVQGEALL